MFIVFRTFWLVPEDNGLVHETVVQLILFLDIYSWTSASRQADFWFRLMLRTRNSQRSDLWAHCPYYSSSSSLLNMHLNQKSVPTIDERNHFAVSQFFRIIPIGNTRIITRKPLKRSDKLGICSNFINIAVLIVEFQRKKKGDDRFQDCFTQGVSFLVFFSFRFL